MPSVISASTASNTALNFSADTSGVLEIRTGSSPTTALTIDASQNATFANVINGNGSGITSINAANVSSGVLAQARGGTGTTTGYYGFKNRIINGAMVIDQRNAGASVSTSSGVSVFTVDRWQAFYSQTNRYTVQQNAGSVTPPAGFRNYLGVTSSAATSLGASDYYLLNQRIEGFNTADLMWGTANAQTVTLSFWVRSSLTGTFGGSINPTGDARSYVFSYTISAANTWEYKTVTIAGDTTGTWNTTNLVGMAIYWGLGVGSSLSTTAGSWVSGSFYAPTGATSVVGTNGATFYITGVQLEVGSTATSFDYRPYGTELALCQRYYSRMTSGSGAGTYKTAFGNGISTGTTSVAIFVQAPVTMRAFPTFNYSSLVATDNTTYDVSVSSITASAFSNNGIRFAATTSGSAMTQFRQAMLVAEFGASNAGYVEFSAEL